MAKALTIKLTKKQRRQLESARDRHPKPYLRERAAAVLQVGEGSSARGVAREKLLKPRDPETVAEWLRRYERNGLEGLLIKAGRGRKPAFSPAPPAGRASQRRVAAPGRARA